MEIPTLMIDKIATVIFRTAEILLVVGTLVYLARTNNEYKAVHAVRVEADSMLSDWLAKKCVPKQAQSRTAE